MRGAEVKLPIKINELVSLGGEGTRGEVKGKGSEMWVRIRELDRW